MSSSRQDKTSRRFQIFILSILAISVVFGLVVALWGAIKNNNTSSAPIHYYSAPAYHVASPVHSRYASPNYDPDLSSPAASRYAPVGPQSSPASDPSVCCDCDGTPAAAPQSSSPQSSSPQGCDEDGNYCDPENPIIGCDNTEFCTKGKNKCSLAWYLGPDKQCSGSPFVCEDNDTILRNSTLGIPCSELTPEFCGMSSVLNDDQTDDEISNICPVTCGICSSSPVRAGPVTAPTSSPQPVPVAAPTSSPQPVPVAAPVRAGPITTTPLV